MKRSQLFILLGILAALAAAAFFKARHPAVEYSFDLYSKVPAGIHADKAARIVIGRDQSVELARAGDRWTIASLWNYPADAGKVETLLKTLQNLEGEVRSEDAQLLGDYGIEDAQAFPVEVFDESGKKSGILLGAKQPDSESTFVRVPGSTAVYLCANNLFRIAGIRGEGEERRAASDFWPDLELLSSKEILENVLEIRTFRENKNGMEPAAFLKKENGGWKFAGAEIPFAVDDEKISYFIEALRQGRAVRAAEPGKDYGFGKKGWRISLTLPEGKALNAFFAEDAEHRIHFQTDRAPYVYEISVYTAKSLGVGNSYFIKDNPLNISADGITGIVLRHGRSEIFLASGEEGGRVFEQLASELPGLEEYFRDSDKIKAENWPKEAPYRIEVKQAGGESVVLEFLEKTEGAAGYPLRISGGEKIYVLGEEKFRGLFIPFTGEAAGAPEEQKTGEPQAVKQ